MPLHSPHALCPSSFRAPGWGAPVLLSSCSCWRSATLRRLAPFSHRLASRIFIRQPGCIPSPMVTQDGDHQFDGGEAQAGLRPLPRPQLQGSSSSICGGGRAETGFHLPHGPAGHLLLQHSGERALTGLAEGADFGNAGPSGRKRRQLQHAWLAGLAGSGAASDATSHRWGGAWLSAHRGAAVAPCAPEDRPGHRTLLGRRSCSWIVLSPLRHDTSARRSVPAHPGGLEWGSAGALLGGAGGKVAAVVGAEVVAAGEGFSIDETVGATRGLTFGSLALIACPRPSSGDVGEGLVAAASALRSSLLLFSRPEWRSLSLLLQSSAVSHLEFVVPQALRGGGCSYPREWNQSSICNGTLSAGVCSLWLLRPEHPGILV
jgi:hypothetical protein